MVVATGATLARDMCTVRAVLGQRRPGGSGPDLSGRSFPRSWRTGDRDWRLPNFPRAYGKTVPGADGPEAAVAAWVQRQRQRQLLRGAAGAGADVLIYAPDQARLSQAAAVHRLALEPAMSTRTWRTFHSGTWCGGIVLALSPDSQHDYPE